MENLETIARKAARKFYKARGAYRFDEFEDVAQDAYLVALIETKKNPAIAPARLYSLIYWRLIDQYRAKTGSRYRRSVGLDPLLFYRDGDLGSDASGDSDEPSVSKYQAALDRVAVDAWSEKERAEKNDRRKVEVDGEIRELSLDELASAFQEVLSFYSDEDRAILLRWIDGEPASKIAESLGLKTFDAQMFARSFKSSVRRRALRRTLRTKRTRAALLF